MSLTRTTFGAGVTASSFDLVTDVPNVSISSVSGVTSGGTAATLTLAFTGDFSTDRTLAVKVRAAAHARSGDLTTNAVTVPPTGVTDTAPSFGGATVSARHFPVGAAIAPFQIPAASGGNGAITYDLGRRADGASSLPSGLKFDATGADADGCPGTAPRTVCGTPTVTGAFPQVLTAHDADTNRLADDRSSLVFVIRIYGASISSTSPSQLTEATLNGATVAVSLAQTTFVSGVTASDFDLVTDIPSVSISSVSGGASGSTTATLTLAFTGDFSTDETLAVKVKASAHARSGDLTTAAVAVTPTDTAPSFARRQPATGFPSGAPIVPFQLPAAAGGNGAVSYTAAGLPAGLRFDATGADAGGCTAADFPTGFTDAAGLAAAPRVVCGTPTRDGASIVVVTAHDADANRAAPDRARLSFAFTVAAPSAAIAWTLPPALDEASLDGAVVGVSLEQSAFVAGAASSGFALATTIPGLSIAQVSDVAAGGTTAALTLSFAGDWRGAGRPLAVRVPAAAHRQAGDLATGAVTVPPAPGLTIAPATSATNRLRTTEAGDTATFTVVLDRAPSGTVALDVTSSDTGEGTAAPSTLTFTPSDWSEAQTVTLTGVDDSPTPSDPNPSAGNRNYTVTVAVDAADTADPGYDALPAATVYAVNADDEYGLEVGAVTGQATEAGGQSTFTVALRTQPSAAVTVTVTSRDAGEGAAAPATLTFAASAWNTAQTVTVTGVQDAVDDGTVTWQVRLDPASGDADYAGVGDVDVDVTTADDDGPPGVVLALAPASIAESGAGSVATVTARLSHPSGAATTVTVAAGTAWAAGADAAIVIAAGATAAASDTATVAAADNATDEPDRTGTVTAAVTNDRAAADGTTMAVTGAALTVRDDDGPPGAALALDPSSVSESGGVATVTAALSHPSSEPSTLTVAPAAGLYTVGSDATIMIAAGATAAASDTVLVTAVDDAIHQGSGGRSATVTAALGNGQGAGAVTGAALTLTDDETLPTVALALSPASIAEEGGVAAVTATLSGPSSAAVTVTVGAAAGTGAVAADFALSTATTLTIAAGSTTSAGTVTVTANGNDVDSPDKAVTVSGTATGGNGVANPPAATLTITDDDALPTVALALSDTSISETGGVATVTAALSGPSSAAVTVTVAAAAGTGAVAADFALSTATTLTIAAGSTTSAGLVTVTANPNDVDSPDKAVTVSGTAAGGNGVADPPAATLTLEDDDSLPTVALALSDSSISETGGISTVTATLTGASSAAVTVTVAAAAGAGAVAADFALSSAATLTIAAGATTSAGLVTVTANGNDVDSPDKAVTVSGTAAGGNGVADPPAVALTLEDDDALPTVALALSDSSITETGGVSTVTATLSGPSSAAVTVTVAAAAGAGAVAADFALSSAATLTIAAGATASAGTVTVTANPNGVDSPNKAVTVSGTAAGGNGVADPPAATLTLEDDDALPTVALALSDTSISETGGVATVTAALSGPSSAAVTVAAAAVSPAVAGDFSLSTATTLTIAAGSTTSAGLVTVTANGNDVDAADKSVTVSGTAAGGNGVASPPAVTLTLADDDTAGIAVSPATSATNRLRTTESADTATFTVKLASEPTGSVVLTVASSDTTEGTAAPATLTFTTSGWSTAQTVTVTGVDDSPPVADGAQDYTVTLTVDQASTADSSYDALSAVTVYANNRDDEFGLNVGSVSGQATEAGGQSTFTVALLTQPSAAVTVTVSSRDGGEGTAAPATLTFTASGWNTAQTVTVTGVQDTIDDGTVTWSVRLDPSSDDTDYNALGSEDVAVTTADDDGPPGVTLALAPASIAESGTGNAATVTARLSHPSGAATTVTVAPVAGLYTAGADAAIVIPAGATAAAADTATVTAADDATDAPDRTGTVTATVTNDRAAADGTTMAVTGAALTVRDDDAAPAAALALNPASVSENGGTSAVSATLSHPSSEPSTVTVTAVSGLYTVGADATIVIAAGATAASADTAAIAAVDDGIHQGSAGRSATVTATLANGQGAGAVTGAALTLTDDEALPTAALALGPNTISEEGGAATVTATLSGPSSAAVTLTVAAAAGMRAAAADFTLSTAATLTIAAGVTASTGTVTIRANGNAVASGDKSVTVSATAAGGNGVASPPDVTLTLEDDDTPRTALVLSASSIAENGGVATVTATLDRQFTQAVTVTVAAAAGANAAAGEFTLSTASTLTFAANATTSTGLVTVTAVNDATDSPDKSVTVSGTASDSLGLANDPANVTLTIADDDAAPGAALALDPASVSEAAGVSTVTATLSNPSSRPSTVTVTAVAGAYTVGTDAAIVIAAGATTAASDTVLVTAVDDQIHQGSAGRSVTVTGALANGQGAGAVTGAVLTLADDETLPTAALALGPASITENGGVSTVTATLSGPSSAAVTVTVAAAAASPAVAGDFTLSAATTLTIAAGVTTSTGTVTVRGVDNGVDAADKTVTVSGTAAGGNGVADPPAAALTLTNDDDAAARLVLTPPAILENAQVATVTATLSHPKTEATTLTVSTAAGADTAAADFAQSSANTLTIAAGATASTGAVTIASVDNPDASGRKRVTVSATAASSRTVANPPSVTLIIRDDEFGLDESAVAGQATEGGGRATFTVALQTQPSAAVTVAVSSRDADGNPDESEGTVAPPALTFTAGNWSAAQTVTVTGVDDDADDGDADWKVRLDPASGDANYDGLADVDVDVTTDDDDGPPGVMLALAPASIPENGGVATVTARLSHPSGAATTLTVTASAGANAAAGDYTLSTPATLTIAAGSISSAGVVTIAARDDDTASPDKAVTVSGTVANDRAAADGTAMAVRAAALTIADDDRKGFAFDPAETVLAAVGGEAAAYTVALTSEPAGTVTVAISIAPDDAGLTVSSSRLTFAPSDWSEAQTVMVTAQPDGDDLADTASLAHAASGGGYGGVAATLAVAISEPGATRIVTGGAAGTTVYHVNLRTVTVTVAEGVREDVEIALPPTLDRAVTVTIAPLPGGRAAEAAGSGHGLGPAESRVAVEVTVSGAPPGGLRLCLPVTTGLRAAARGRTLVLLRRGEPVAGSEDEGTQVCADGVASFSPFAVGYADTAPEFPDDYTIAAMVFTVNQAVETEPLRLARGGDGTRHELLPERLVDELEAVGVEFDPGTRVFSGTPTKAFRPRPGEKFTWTATDIDGQKAELEFTIEVKAALEDARARLKKINESVLPELSRAMWGSALDAVTGRLGGVGVPGAGGGGSAGLAGGLAAVDAALRANADKLKDGRASLRELLDGRRVALRLGASGSGAAGSGAVVWASGDWRKLSRKQAGLDWSGDLFAAHLGADAALGSRLRGGIAASRFTSAVTYTDGSALAVSSAGAAVTGKHRTRMTTVTPYVGVYGDGTLVWAALGVGGGRVEIDDAEVIDQRLGRQSSGSKFTAAAVGGSARLVTGGALEVRVKAAGEASRFSVSGNGEEGAILPLAAVAQRLRLSAEGSRTWALGSGAQLTPVVEVGGRWDGGDGATGAGLEVGAGVAWSDPGAGLTVEARARALVAHRSARGERGISAAMRLDPGARGRGLSFALSPSWGKAESGVERLWDEGMAARAGPVGGGASGARLEAELGYGFRMRDGVLTPHAGFGYEARGRRRYRLGTRFDLGAGLAVDVQAERKEGAAAPEHTARIDLRLRW